MPIRLPAVAAVAAVAAVLAAVLSVRAADAGPASEVPLGAVLSEQDRRDLAAVPAERGAEPLPPDPAVDPADPVAVARAYLATAGGATAADAGRTHLRAAAYALPGSPPAEVGVVVLDAPPPGVVRTAVVEGLDLVAADPGDRRRGYLATVRLTDSPSAATSTRTTYVVLTRQPDGRWLVSAESPDLPAGED